MVVILEGVAVGEGCGAAFSTEMFCPDPGGDHTDVRTRKKS